MELLDRAKAVRLRSHHGKYLHADEDGQHVSQGRDAASPNARWSVESVLHGAARFVRLRSRFGRYLTASNEPFLLGASGRRVLQSSPARRLDSSVDWEPLPLSPGGPRLRLRTRYGNFLRANAGLPPWRNSVTHDIPHRSATQDWVLWDVELLEALPPPSPAAPSLPYDADADADADADDDDEPPHRSFLPPPPPPPPSDPHLSKLESSDSFSGGPIYKVEGRTIHYVVADDGGGGGGAGDSGDADGDGRSFTFDGTSLEELSHRLEEETRLSGIIICSRNPLNGELYPLRLHLPPNNAAMHVVVVRESSKVGRTFQGD